MRFVIRTDEFGDVVNATWTLERKDGTAICENATQSDAVGFPSEAAARSDIAAAKTAMKGAKFAKVEVE